MATLGILELFCCIRTWPASKGFFHTSEMIKSMLFTTVGTRHPAETMLSQPTCCRTGTSTCGIITSGNRKTHSGNVRHNKEAARSFDLHVLHCLDVTSWATPLHYLVHILPVGKTCANSRRLTNAMWSCMHATLHVPHGLEYLQEETNLLKL